MPKWLRYLILALFIVIGFVPILGAPGIAESYGWDREDGSTVGGLVAMAWFGTGWWISYKIIRRQERRRLEREFGPILEQYRNDDRKDAE